MSFYIFRVVREINKAKNNKDKILRIISFFLYAGMFFLLIVYPDFANSGPYLDSAHGNVSYGVNRTSLSAFGYSTANCAHCHEQHAMIGGGEPSPSGGPDNYALFYTNHVTQTNNFCFKCHTDLSSLQTTGLINRSYSYRAGGYTSDTLNDILEAFSFISPGSSHNLDNILTFITGESWGYSDDSNPCGGCHNPHRVQGDPSNAENSAKTSATRGWPASRPSQHSKNNNSWGLWGDNTGERMSDYTANYQAPYCYNSTTTYEPDGSTTQDGSNLTDFVTFCQDCHNASNIYSTTLGRNLKLIRWGASGDKHGRKDANVAISLDNPYDSVMGKVLACTDCHEPHGAPNVTLIRKEVNGGQLGGTITNLTSTDNCYPPPQTPPYNDTNNEMAYLCNRCHKDDYEFDTNCQQNRYYHIHHGDSTDPFYTGGGCNTCHSGMGGPGLACNRNWDPINCNCCHYHGSFSYGKDTF